ncbi:hypothetical protein E4U19_000166, partial [Claviceps sp. Clav32 group G5]
MDSLACLASVAALASPASPAPPAALACVASLTPTQRHTIDTTPSPQPQTQPDVKVTRERRPWLPHEDYLLICMVKDRGAHHWAKISGYVGSRSAKQCRERWRHILDPHLKHESITREEGQFIVDWVDRKGQQWAEIARHLEGRSDNGVKNWYNARSDRIR